MKFYPYASQWCAINEVLNAWVLFHSYFSTLLAYIILSMLLVMLSSCLNVQIVSHQYYNFARGPKLEKSCMRLYNFEDYKVVM